MTNCQRCGLEGDYMPKGNGRANHPVNVRIPEPYEFYRCGVQTGYDCQSGSIYCGHKATLVADEKDQPGQLIAVCNRHEGVMKDLVRRREMEEKERREEAERRESHCDLWDGH